MAKKEANLGVRVTEETRLILERLAKEGYRSVSQQIAMIISQWLEAHGHLKPDKPAKK